MANSLIQRVGVPTIRHVMRTFLVLLAFVALMGIQLFAQTTGSLRGSVMDPSGAAVPDATVLVQLEGSSLRRETITSDVGEYRVLALPVGMYRVEISKSGFKTFVRTNVQIRIDGSTTLDTILEIGDVTEMLTAEASLPLIETSSTQLGATVSSREVTKLPLSSRDTYQLLQLQPGVMSQVGLDELFGSDRAGVVSISGGRGRSNNFNVNGGEANDLYAGTPAIQPTPDTIEEIRVVTNTFDAEYGRNSGGQVNVVTKSGTNDFHGGLFHFFRNRALNARGFFDTKKPQFNQNQYGFTLGGPIKKNKTFFFGSLERSAVRQGIASDLVFLPTVAERMGDFSAGDPFAGTLNDRFLAQQIAGRPGCQTAVSRIGGAPIQAGTPWASIFPGNRIPVACFDATAFDLMQQYVPLPNVGGRFFQTVPSATNNTGQVNFRVDHDMNKVGRLEFFFFRSFLNRIDPFTRLAASGANVPGFGSINEEYYYQSNLGHTWVVNPTTVNEVRFTWYRQDKPRFVSPQNSRLLRDSCAGVPADRCFTDPLRPELGIRDPGFGPNHEGVPYISVSGGFAIGNNYEGEILQNINTFHFYEKLSIVAGRHNIKFGGDFRRFHYAMQNFGALNGQFQYFGGGPNDVGFENLFPNYLLGMPDYFYQTSPGVADFRNNLWSLWANDSWRIHPSLTFNLGVRYEMMPPPTDRFRTVQSFRPGLVSTTFPCELKADNPLVKVFGSRDCRPGGPAEAVFPLGIAVPGDPGVPPGLTQTYRRAIAPRAGLAWSPGFHHGILYKLFGNPGDFSIRTSWGLFYNNPIEGLILAQFVPQPPFGGSSVVFNPTFNTPFVSQSGREFANPFGGFPNPPRGEGLDWSIYRPLQLLGQVGPDLRTQYSAQYNFMIQRKLGRDSMVEIGYVGSQGHRLLATRDINFGRADTCLDLNEILGPGTCGPFQADQAFFVPAGTMQPGQRLRLPYGSVRVVEGPNLSDITLVGLREYSSPFCEPTTGAGCAPDGIPSFASIFQRDSIAKSAYHSMQSMFRRRFAQGLQIQAAYTWSKSIDNASSFESIINPLNYRLSRSLSLFDARHRFVTSYYWDLPGRKLRGLTGAMFGNWALTGITTLQSGFPIRITSSDDTELMSSADFEMPGQPNIVRPFVTQGARRPDNLWFDPDIFEPAELGRFGNAPRTICCGPGIANFDVAMHKNIYFKEKYNFELRSEFFNVFNHAQFFNPGGNISEKGDFGRIRRARQPRLIQFALKLHF